VKSVLFDLDGTLTDSRDGIVKCIQFALSRSGVVVPPTETISSYIGVPLRGLFRDLMGNPSPDAVEAAVRLYRERFDSTGIYENKVYPGAVELLERIRDRGWLAYVVTSKAETVSRRVVEHFSLGRFFAAVHGSDMDGARAEKSELIEYVLKTESIATADAVMIGDRCHDIKGALANGLPSIGVSYGYGSRDELAEAGATWICDQPHSIMRVLVEHFGDES
jgi:phosphoglycolate phosphatase